MYIYLKFGTEENMTDMFYNGTIYCSPIKFFAENHDGCRFDENELVSDLIYIEKGTINIKNEIDGTETTLQVQNFQCKGRINNPVGNIYCLFALDIETPANGHEFLFDKRLAGFGTHVIVITNAEEFVKRLTAAIKKENIEFERKKVDYLTLDRFTGKKTLFMKDIEFEYQKEARLHLMTGKTTAHILSIGSMEDIAQLYLVDLNTFRMRKDTEPPEETS